MTRGRYAFKGEDLRHALKRGTFWGEVTFKKSINAKEFKRRFARRIREEAKDMRFVRIVVNEDGRTYDIDDRPAEELVEDLVTTGRDAARDVLSQRALTVHVHKNKIFVYCHHSATHALSYGLILTLVDDYGKKYHKVVTDNDMFAKKIPWYVYLMPRTYTSLRDLLRDRLVPSTFPRFDAEAKSAPTSFRFRLDRLKRLARSNEQSFNATCVAIVSRTILRAAPDAVRHVNVMQTIALNTSSRFSEFNKYSAIYAPVRRARRLKDTTTEIEREFEMNKAMIHPFYVFNSITAGRVLKKMYGHTIDVLITSGFLYFDERKEAKGIKVNEVESFILHKHRHSAPIYVNFCTHGDYLTFTINSKMDVRFEMDKVIESAERASE